MIITVSTHGAKMPEQHGDWTDLYTAEDVIMAQGEYKRISLGISMQLPTGYYAIIAPRSSTYEKYGIIMANSIGIIDNSYCGDNDIWQFPAIALRGTKIPAGTRICQFLPIKKGFNSIIFEKIEWLMEPDRGGFGTTG